MNSFKRVRAFQIELKMGMLVFKERGKPEYPEKNSWSKGENQQQTQPIYGFDTWISTGATLVGGECSHPHATLAPQITSQTTISNRLDVLFLYINCLLEIFMHSNVH